MSKPQISLGDVAETFPGKEQQMRTREVKKLVEKALDSLPRPYTEDVIDCVFCAIQSCREWREEYEVLCQNLGRNVVNQWGGKWIYKKLEGEPPVVKKGAKSKNRLTDSYSKLNVTSVN